MVLSWSKPNQCSQPVRKEIGDWFLGYIVGPETPLFDHPYYTLPP